MSKCLKGVSGKVIVDEKGITDSWKEYTEKLINEENEWDHRISAGVKEGPADCIRTDEAAAALKKMKRHKALGLSGLVLSSRNDTSHRGILELSGHWIYAMVLWKKVASQRTESQVWYYQFTKGNGIQWSVDLTEELNCWNILWKWWKGYSHTEFSSRLI